MCGSRWLRPWKHLGKWTLVRCPECDIVSIDPLPSSQDLLHMYEEEYYKDRRLQDDHSPEAVQAEINARLTSARTLMKEVAPPCRWLDIGCASGYLLAAGLRLGASIQGVEISHWAVGFAVGTLGLPVYQGVLEEFVSRSRPAPFNLITAMAYLEHTLHPADDLDAMASLLAPGGVLVIRVPNLSSFDRRWHGDAWHGWHLPYHLHHFSPTSLSRLLLNRGLRVYRIDTGIWNPLVHLREARLGNGWRADHPLEGRPSLRETAASPDRVHDPRPSAIRNSVKRILGRFLSGRDMIVYARR